MKKEKPEEVLANPLWMFPVFLLIIFGGIQAIHTWAHWHGEIDVHGYCRQNKEYIQSLEEEEDW